MSLIRAILLAVREAEGEHPYDWIELPKIRPAEYEARPRSWVWENHVRLACEGRLLDSFGDFPTYMVRLTDLGHDFVDLAQSDGAWFSAENAVRWKLNEAAPFDIWMELLRADARRRLTDSR